MYSYVRPFAASQTRPAFCVTDTKRMSHLRSIIFVACLKNSGNRTVELKSGRRW